MILHRLRLNNFRGVADREICFPEHGVVVVCGPNEIGKSSMLEALDLLLTYRDRSNHRDVKQVKPANSDVGAEVEAEITTGPYRFVYRKRFHKKAKTELEIIEPKPEQCSGDQAHERVEAMLNETVDTKLWEAQRVLQAASTHAVNLSGSDALSRALDAAAGETDAAPAGADSYLIDLVDAEYQRYFTGTGRPTKDWKAAIDRLAAADAEVARCTAAVEEVDDRVRRHEELTGTLRELAESLAPATERLNAAREARSVLAELAEQLDQAQLAAQAAANAAANAAMGNGQRLKLVDEVQRRAATQAALHTELLAAQTAGAAAREAADNAAKSAEQAEAALLAAQQRLESARAIAKARVAHDEADEVAARVVRIDEAEANLKRFTAELAAVALTDDLLTAIEDSATLVERLTAQLQADAATVQFTAPADLQITVDGEQRTLAAGQQWTQPASAAVVVDVPGVLTIRIDPGDSTVKLHADLVAAQATLADALAEVGVPDLAGARKLDKQRRTLTDRSLEQAAGLKVLCDGEDPAQLRARLVELRAAAPEAPGVDAATAAAELSAADDARDQARATADVQRKAAAAATVTLTEKVGAVTLLQEQVKAADAELVAVRDQLVTLRSAVSDAAVAEQATAATEAQRQADVALAAVTGKYDSADPAAVEAEVTAALGAAEALGRAHAEAKQALHDISVELGIIGSEGRQGLLDEAEAELEQSRAEHTRIGERAAAAQLLRDTMARHRDNTRARYMQPYRTELERLGRKVFGDTFSVDVDTELTIQTRTLDGCTVPFDSLSGGAKEQLGILARLAGAALVANEDTVPVVIDDALGFSDPDRLDRMAAVFSTVGDRGQVIVLTCTPGRYDRVADAEVIEICA